MVQGAARQVQLSSSLHTENCAYGYFVANSPDSLECKKFAKLAVLGNYLDNCDNFPSLK